MTAFVRSCLSNLWTTTQRCSPPSASGRKLRGLEAEGDEGQLGRLVRLSRIGMGAIAAGGECASIGLWLRQAGPPASGPGGCRATDRDRTPRRLALNQTRVT